MTTDTFDTITRSAGMAQRRTVLGLGAAGLATTLAGTFGAAAKQNAGKKAKKKARKKCKQQQASCVDGVTTSCAQFEDDAPLCQALFLPCCDACDVSVGVICAINAFGQA